MKYYFSFSVWLWCCGVSSVSWACPVRAPPLSNNGSPTEVLIHLSPWLRTELLLMCLMAVCVCSGPLPTLLYLFSYSIVLAGYKLTTLLTQPLKVPADGHAQAWLLCPVWMAVFVVAFCWLSVFRTQDLHQAYDLRCFPPLTGCSCVPSHSLDRVLWCRIVFKIWMTSQSIFCVCAYV